MAFEPFGVVGGLSVGIPAVLVIDSNGNITSNRGNIANLSTAVINSSGNITAPYFIGNVVGNVSGNFVVPGTNTSVLYNQVGNAGASDAFQFDYATNVLSLTGNITVTNILTDNYLYANGSPYVFEAQAAGSNNQIQFNIGNVLTASSNLTFDSTNNIFATDTISAIDASITSIVSEGVLVNGNIIAEYVVSNFVGNLSGANIVSANYLTGTLTTHAQPNITSVGTLSGLTVAGNIMPGANIQYNLGSNVTRWKDLYLGGNTIYLGNASIEANATAIIFTNPDGSNYVLGGNDLTISGNVIAGGNVVAGNSVSANYLIGTLVTANQPNITHIGTLSNLTVSGNINASNVVAVNKVTANQLSGLIVTAAQPNITSVGILNGLSVSGNITGANWIVSSYLSGNGNPITYINGANVFGVVANATYAVNANISNIANIANTANLAGHVTNSSQPNITSVGTLTSLSVTGNVTASTFIGNILGNITNANFASYTANVTASSQPNITSVGTLTSLTSSGNVTAPNFIGNFVGNLTGNIANANFASYSSNVTSSSQPNITSVGTLTSLTASGNITAPNFIGNVVGNATSANFASYAGNITVASQPNITSVGTLTSLSVTGNVNANNFVAINRVTATELSGLLVTASQPNITTLGTLTNLSVAGNIIGGNLVSANFLTGTLTTQTQANIHTVGNLGFLNVDTSLPGANGNITFNGSMSGIGTQSDISITGDVSASNIFATFIAGELTTNEQPAVTLLGNLTELTVVGPANLGNVGNITILGGNANYVLTTDGAGNLSWAVGGGGGTPGGSNTQVQFNTLGSFDGSSSFTFNDVTKLLYVNGNIQANRLISTVANGTSPFVVTSTTKVSNLSVETANTATFATSSTNSNVALTVANAAQPNITSVGNLTSLNVAGNIVVTGRGNITGNLNVGNLDTIGTLVSTTATTTGNSTVNGVLQVGSSGSLKVLGNVNTASSSNVFLGNVENIHISGGINGYVLATDGFGNLTWSAGGGGGGNGIPGGSNTQVQYNDNGAFGGSAFLTFNESTNTFQIAGNLVANTTQIGAGVYKFSTSSVYAATTSSTSANQLLWSTLAANVSGIDFHIISTDLGSSTRQVSKISSVILGNIVQWNEYGSLLINGGVGSFDVAYAPGNIIVAPTIELRVTPDSTNTTSYKIMITEYTP